MSQRPSKLPRTGPSLSNVPHDTRGATLPGFYRLVLFLSHPPKCSRAGPRFFLIPSRWLLIPFIYTPSLDSRYKAPELLFSASHSETPPVPRYLGFHCAGAPTFSMAVTLHEFCGFRPLLFLRWCGCGLLTLYDLQPQTNFSPCTLRSHLATPCNPFPYHSGTVLPTPPTNWFTIGPLHVPAPCFFFSFIPKSNSVSYLGPYPPRLIFFASPIVSHFDRFGYGYMVRSYP